MKRLRSNIITLIVVSSLILFIVLKNDFNEIIDVLLKCNKIYIFIAIVVILLGDIFKGLSLTWVIKKSKKGYRFKDGFPLTLKTNFFNGVTPFSLGGQPFQLYLLKKKNNIDYITGANILFKDFYTYQMALVILSTICLVINYLLNIVNFSTVIRELIWLGYFINFVTALFLIYLPYSKTYARKAIKFIASLLYKIKIIKDKEKVINEINNSITDFKNQISNAIKDKGLIVKCIILNILKFIMMGIATYFCFKSVNTTVPLLECIVIIVIIITMASFVPIPGASGGMEYGFIVLFAYFAIDVKLSAAMLIWRFLTYYVPAIFGGILVLFESRE